MFGCILIVGVLFYGYSFAAIGSIHTNRVIVKHYTDGAGNEYSIYKKPAITVIAPKTFSMHFFSQGMKIAEFSDGYGCNASLNSTYFGNNDDGSYFPAGVWYQFGSYLRNPYQPAIDRNLRVLLSGDGTTIDFIDNNSFDFTSLQGKKNGWYGNAGPRLVRDGRINHDIVEKKSHWQRDTTRAGIVRNPGGKIYFVIATDPISLPQFISFSYSVGLGTGAFQFVNIDGGSSTALVTPYNSYKRNKKLPSFICIH